MTVSASSTAPPPAKNNTDSMATKSSIGVSDPPGASPSASPAAPTPPDENPPSYDAVVAQKQTTPLNAANPTPGSLSLPSPWTSITVVDPVKQGDGVNAYISYKIVTHERAIDEAPTSPDKQHAVIRRFRDFYWLRQSLAKQYAGVILPPLPPRNVVEKYKMATEFIEDRRRALERFLVKTAEHAMLNRAASLRLFLTASESEFNIESSRMSQALGSAAPAESGGASGLATSALNTASKLWRNLTDNAGYVMNAPQALSGSNAVQHHVRSEESPEYAALRQYYNHLEAHLNELHSQAQRLTKQHERFGSSLSEFGAALGSLSSLQMVDGSSPPTTTPTADADTSAAAAANPTSTASSDEAQSTAVALGQKARVAGQGWVSVSAELHANFEQPLRELLRAVQSAKKTIEDRDEALQSKIQAQMNVDAKRAMVARLQATPGTRQDRVMAEERSLQQAIEKSEEATKFYKELVERMDTDIERFQKERQADLQNVLVRFGEILATCHSRTGSESWS
jgi:sorting nexin-1/2